VGLAAVQDLREMRGAAGPEEIERFEVEALGGFVLARSAAGLSDSTIHSDVSHLERVRNVRAAVVGHGSGRCRRLLRHGVACGATEHRLARAQAIKTYFEFVELRHKVEIHNMCGQVPGRAVLALRDPREPATRDEHGRPLCPSYLGTDPVNHETCSGCGRRRPISAAPRTGRSARPACPGRSSPATSAAGRPRA
jgi:hypothetical protein